MMASLLRHGIRYRGIILALVAIITLLACMGLSKLVIDTSFDSLIPVDSPARTVYKRVVDEFGSDNKTIIYIEDQALWTPTKLAKFSALVTELKGVKHVIEVDSLMNLRTLSGARHAGKRTVSAGWVLDGIPKTKLEATDAKARALKNPLYRGNLFSEDGNATAVVVTLDDGLQNEQGFNQSVHIRLQRLLDQYAADFEQIFQVGPPRISAELAASIIQDLSLLGPLSAVVLILAIVLFMRSRLAAIIPIVTSALSIIWTFGMLGWLGVPLSLLTAMIPSLIIVIGSTEDTHMMAAFFRGIDDDLDKPQSGVTAKYRAIATMFKHTGLPLVLTLMTTALGFASNLFSSIGLIQDFAIASTFAILANGIITIIVVPILLVQFGPVIGADYNKNNNHNDNDNDNDSDSDGDVGKKAAKQNVAGSEAIFGNYLTMKIIQLFRVLQDRFPNYTLLFTATLCVFCTYHAGSLYVTNDPMSYFPEDRPLIQQSRLIHEKLAGIKVFYITLGAETENAFLIPDNLRKLEAIQGFMRKQGGFDSTLSLVDHLKYVNGVFEGEFARLRLPKSQALTAQYLLFFHRSELQNYVSHDYKIANIVVRHNINDSNNLNQYVVELEQAIAHIVGTEFNVDIVSENLMVNRAANSLMMSQLKALGLLLVIIFIIMSVMFTSLKGGAIAIIPALIPIVLMFGMMGLFEIPLNPGTAMVAVIAVGIAVDGTIHLLARYQELSYSTSDYRAAVNQAVEEVATPLIVSSLALTFGFAVLMFSSFTVVAQFGALAAATMLISIFANLLITPIIMRWVRLVCLVHIIAIDVDQEVLGKSPLFQNMSNYQRRKAILISELHEFQPGEKLIEQGTVGRSMYVILEGEAEVVRHESHGSRKLTALNSGEIFGEIGYIRSIKRTADVTALTAVSVLRFDYQRMQKDLKFFPHIAAQLNFNISGILGDRLADVLAD
ncbi:MAG: MMPL family transporter [Pseudomonadales bacterium]|nr:MMPL family transporter [Pseudomonadales bacterium]